MNVKACVRAMPKQSKCKTPAANTPQHVRSGTNKQHAPCMPVPSQNNHGNKAHVKPHKNAQAHAVPCKNKTKQQKHKIRMLKKENTKNV